MSEQTGEQTPEMAEAIAAMTEGLDDDEKEMFELLGQGAQIKDFKDISNDEIEAMYAVGYNFYKQEKYEEAENIFRYVCMMAHLETSYWMALGNCLMMKKDYEGAINTFGHTYGMDVDDPWPVINTARCYLGLKDKENAAAALDLADRTLELNEGEDELAKDRIAGLRAGLED